MSFRSGMRPFSRKPTSKKASKQASIQQLLLRGAQRRAEQQLAKDKIRKALVEVKTKHSVEIRCQKEVEVIEILSSSDDQARNAAETQENLSQRHKAIEYEMQQERDAERQSRGSPNFESSISQQSSFSSQLSQQDIPEIAERIQVQPFPSSKAFTQVRNISVQANLSSFPPSAKILRIRQSNGKQVIDLLISDQVRTFSRAYTEQHYLHALIHYYESLMQMSLKRHP